MPNGPSISPHAAVLRRGVCRGLKNGPRSPRPPRLLAINNPPEHEQRYRGIDNVCMVYRVMYNDLMHDVGSVSTVWWLGDLTISGEITGPFSLLSLAPRLSDPSAA